MKFGAEEIQQTAAALGFRPDSLEKVFRLLSLLETLRSNAFLRPRIALKGGTALNIFLLDVPRLSVDIDLNYVGSGDRSTMLADKPKVEQAIQAVCGREGLTVKRMPSEHAGGKWRLAFVVYGGLNRRDWRTVRIDDVAADALELKRELVPMLRAGIRPPDAQIPSWAEGLVRETRELMAAVLPLEAHEREFLERLNGAGDIAPELLTAEPAMQGIIRDHPGLKWKALNVKKRLGAAAGDEEPTE